MKLQIFGTKYPTSTAVQFNKDNVEQCLHHSHRNYLSWK